MLIPIKLNGSQVHDFMAAIQFEAVSRGKTQDRIQVLHAPDRH